MIAQVKLHHWLLLTGLSLLLVISALLWSTRSLGYPNPEDARRPVNRISALSAAERDVSITRFSLICMDALVKAKPRDAIKYCPRMAKRPERRKSWLGN